MAKNENEEKKHSQEEKKEEEFDAVKILLAVVFFVFSYGIIFAIGSAYEQIGSAVANIPILNLILPLPQVWDSPMPIWHVSMMHLLMPVFGFWAVFFLLGLAEKYFEFKYAKIAFTIIFVVFCLGAFYVSLAWFAAYSASASGQPAQFDFWGELRNSAFYLFLVSGLFGIAAKIAAEKIKI